MNTSPSRCILGICGRSKSGKDTVADYLVARYGFKNIAFADALKTLIRYLFNVPVEVLYGAPDARNQPLTCVQDPTYWDQVSQRFLSGEFAQLLQTWVAPEQFSEALDRLGKMIVQDFRARSTVLTSRHLLQQIGTNWGQKLQEDFWHRPVATTIVLAPPNTNWVVRDCRFIHELQFVQKLGGQTLWLDASIRIPDSGLVPHVSEPQLSDVRLYIQQVLDNNGDLDALYRQLDALVRPSTLTGS